MIPFELRDHWPRHFGWFISVDHVQRPRSQIKVHGYKMKSVSFFRLQMQSIDWIVKVKLGKPITAHCGKMQSVTTLCWLQCGMAELCIVLSPVALVVCLSSYFVGVTSTKSFLGVLHMLCNSLVLCWLFFQGRGLTVVATVLQGSYLDKVEDVLQSQEVLVDHYPC